MGAAESRESAEPTAQQEQGPAVPSTSESACPLPEAYRNPAVYNVYNQRVNDPACPIAQPRIDPRNNMPLEPNQMPAPGQRKLISTLRATSAIPKGGTDATWVYPSPQMFYNGKSANVTAQGLSGSAAGRVSIVNMLCGLAATRRSVLCSPLLILMQL